MIIDTHCHVYPKVSELVESAKDFLPFDTKKTIEIITKVEDSSQLLKPFYRTAMKPYLNLLHLMQTRTRDADDKYIDISDKLVSVFGAANTLLDNNIDDLLFHMEKNQVKKSVIIAHPPFIPNDFILKIASKRPEFVPIVNIPFGEVNAAKKFRRFIKLGAKGLKIHAAAHGGDDLYDQHYTELLSVAEEFNLPVIIHTGCIHIKPLYKNPDLGHAEHFENWFKDYSKVNFVLAHMNYHFPETAIGLCNLYENVYTDTSWQPIDSIQNAIKTCDNSKILFGSDWPIIGDNIYINAQRILEAQTKNVISAENCDKILFKNAQSLFNI